MAAFNVSRRLCFFAFNGTGVWLYGGLRSNYGSYQGSAKSTQTQLKHVLCGISGLQMGKHMVTLTNEGGGPSTLTALSFKRGSVTTTKIDDASSNVKYGPKSTDWSLTNGTSYYDKTLHYSTTNGAYASLSFTGNAVAIYGTVDPQHANYTVTLDGAKSQQFKASNARIFHTQYFAQGLESKQHTITLTGSVGTNADQYFDLDSFAVYSATPNATSTTSSSGAPSSTATMNSTNNSASNNGTVSANTSNGSSLSQGSLIGIIVGTIAALLLLLLALFFYLQPPDLEAAYDYALREKELSPEDLRPSIDMLGRPTEDYYGPKTVTAKLVAFPLRLASHDSDRTLRDEKQPPSRKASRPDEVPMLVVHNPPPESGHARIPSDTSTVVNDEVDAGLSEIILSPSKSQRRPPASPRSARPRPNREELRATQYSALSYYYHDS
ncbi:uncharacterized protein B0H18DRAFT_976693 [Fomitopsis serialis]|uniref:uncharacterized protein n=1 Tax=Fomitopsis serialis TaxID=139415 RepID=UPI0020082548|nr:uncharacterized protein B0H18DRAFT_976693 [Neoantrodia serialis]KAH9935651.1 hypothetical protein B0H18DRAFT_976693 [Neoantrodia serialis]